MKVIVTFSGGKDSCMSYYGRYENSHTHQCIGEQLEFDLVDLLCNRIEWIVSNGYELNL